MILPEEYERQSDLPSVDIEQFFRNLVEPLDEALRSVERAARKERRTIPAATETNLVIETFWDLMTRLRAIPNVASNRQTFQRLVHPWLLRGSYWNRAFAKPHGYAGDYRMVEMMYDLEGADCQDPTRSVMENVLDQLFATVHSVHAVWDRRRLIRDLVLNEAWDHSGPVRVLDVACGGARYLHDAARSMNDPERLHVTLVDQDPAALAYAAPRLRTAGVHVTEVCEKVRTLHPGQLPETEYDVVLSTGLFDYLPDADAQQLLTTMEAVSASHGVVAICNFSAADPSRVVKDWVVEWPLIYRNEAELAAIWPYGPQPSLSVSREGSLLYASRRW